MSTRKQHQLIRRVRVSELGALVIWVPNLRQYRVLTPDEHDTLLALLEQGNERAHYLATTALKVRFRLLWRSA